MSGITCSDCLTGFVKGGTPTGTVTTVHGLPTYITRPSQEAPNGVIILLPDIFGWEMSNARLLADTYAKQGGYLVYLPNFMNRFIPTASTMRAMDNLLAPSPSIFTTIFMKPIWLFQVIAAAVPFLMFNGSSTITPKVFGFHKALREDPATKDLKVGSAGFCWGGKYTTLLCQEDNLVDAGFTAHPSKMKFPDDYDKVQKPLSIAIGDVDLGIKIDMVKNIKTLLEEMKTQGQNEVVIYPGAKHGFAMRANPAEEGEVKNAGEATTQAISWFAKWLS